MKRSTKKLIAIIFALSACGLVLIIWINSLQTVTDSRSLSRWVLTALQQTFPQMDILFSGNAHHYLRKAAHFLVFATLGLLSSLACLSYGLKPKRYLGTQLYLGLLIAVLDEFIQLNSDGRGPQVSDILLDHAGFILGCGVVLLGYGIIKVILSLRSD